MNRHIHTALTLTGTETLTVGPLAPGAPGEPGLPFIPC